MTPGGATEIYVSTNLCGGRWLGKDKHGRWQWGEFPSRKRFQSREEADAAFADVVRAMFGDVKIEEAA